MTAHIKGNILTVDGVKSRLPPQEIVMLWAVMARKAVSEDDIMEMLWPHPDNMPDNWGGVLGILRHRLNAKLKVGGWGIKKPYGKPFSLVRA